MSSKNTMPWSERISFNPDYCSGCECCEQACSAAHFGAFSKNLSAIRVRANFHKSTREAFVCKQCKAASCVDVCPKGAIKFDEATGARYIDNEICIKCGLCVKACPFTDQANAFPLIRKCSFEEENVMVKCDLCHGIEGGPACVAVCPRGALTIVEGKKGGKKND